MVRVYLLSVIKIFTILIVTTALFIFLNDHTKSEEVFKKTRQVPAEEVEEDYCEVVHIGLLCVTQSAKINLYTLLKSIFSNRSNPLHFHIVVNSQTNKSISKLFESWAVQQVDVSFYNLNDLDTQNGFSNNLDVVRVVLPQLIDLKNITKIILLSTDIVLNDDINQLWHQFKLFDKYQILGIPLDPSKKHREKINADVVLYHLENLHIHGWNKIWRMIQDHNFSKYSKSAQLQLIMETFIAKNLEYVLPCGWDSKNVECSAEYKVISYRTKSEVAKFIISSFASADGNLLRKHENFCSEKSSLKKISKFQRPITDKCFNIGDIDIRNRRTLLYVYNYSYESTKSDVTLISQLSFNKLNLIEKFAKRWKGPMSLSLYLTDVEYINCIKFIKNSKVLRNRLNIGYHIVFKYGPYYQINYLRNVALREVNTPYVFIDDIDLIPMQNLHGALKMYLNTIPDMNKKALVVPAFQTRNLNVRIPYDMIELTQMLKNKKVLIFQKMSRPEGQEPTNYSEWMTADKPYLVKWKNKYEPYVVIRSDVVQYDERFFGYGWNKISHIMEIEAQDYQFYVLPNVFIVHKYHTRSKDFWAFRTSSKFKKCLKSIKKQSVKELNLKYGRTFFIN